MCALWPGTVHFCFENLRTLAFLASARERSILAPRIFKNRRFWPLAGNWSSLASKSFKISFFRLWLGMAHFGGRKFQNHVFGPLAGNNEFWLPKTPKITLLGPLAGNCPFCPPKNLKKWIFVASGREWSIFASISFEIHVSITVVFLLPLAGSGP